MRKFLLAYTMLAALGAPAMAEPFVSGSEPVYGKHMDAKQRRMLGEDDVRTALKHNRQPTPVVNGVPGYAFKLQTFRHEGQGSGGGRVQGGGGGGGAGVPGQEGSNRPIPPSSSPPQWNPIQSKFFGVFKNLQECDAARAEVIANLDDRNERFWHQRADAPTITTYIGNGMSTTQQVVLKERKDVTFCEPGIYSPGKPSQPSPNIAKGDETTGTAASVAQTTNLDVPPGSVEHWIAPRPFTRVVPGTSEVVEILSAKGHELIFMVKPDVGGMISSETSTAFGTTTTSTANLTATNILLLDDNGDLVANLRIKIADPHNRDIRQGQNGTQVYRKDNPNYVPPKGGKK
jgi:hypothetical protein